jgi:hypothetical protein
MFPGGIEYVAEERRKDFLREAERMRLINSLQRRRSNEREKFREVVNWMGTQLVNWGLKLQSYKTTSPSQIKAMGVADVECPQC